MAKPGPILSTFLLAWTISALSCKEEIVPEEYQPTDAHDAYRHGLAQAGLAATALGRDWLAAADSALQNPVEIKAPFREVLYVDAASAFAIGYRYPVKHGQRIQISVSWDGPAASRLFIDLFRIEDDRPPVQVASAPEGGLELAFEPRNDRDYLVRVQSELLRGGRLTLTIVNRASLQFPVAGTTQDAIQSGFGAPRDGGRRRHHGVDIFVPRHTSVIAPSQAFVSFVGDRGIGGNVVWLRDFERSLSIYFAHLQTQSVQQGTWVEPGDVIGTVGNSGNARTTPPHLHFGIYMRGRGPLDPMNFIRRQRIEPDRVHARLESLGRWGRTNGSESPLYASPSRRSEALLSLGRHTPLLVLGGVARFYRVRLPDGMDGFVPARAIEPAEEPLAVRTLDSDRVFFDRPTPEASPRGEIPSGSKLRILGSFGSFEWILEPGGQAGWLAP